MQRDAFNAPEDVGQVGGRRPHCASDVAQAYGIRDVRLQELLGSVNQSTRARAHDLAVRFHLQRLTKNPDQ